MRLLKYILFLIGSNNAHGIHSPFVYELYTKGLKNKRIQHTDRIQRAILQLKNHFQLDKIYFSDDFNQLTPELNNASVNDVDQAQIICCDSRQTKLIAKGIETSSKPVFIARPYHSKTTENYWNTIIKHTSIDVSVDCFFYGILFFRPQQHKEHFKLRL